MDHLINKFISKKLRKKGDEYQLSENSKRTAQDFGQLSAIASKIYQYLVAISPRLRDGSMFNAFVALLRQVRTENQALPEEIAEHYTHAHMLTDFSLNRRASWNTLLPWRPQFEVLTDQQQVQISLPADKNWLLKAFPERLSRIEITFHTLVVNLAQPQEKEVPAHTNVLFIRPQEGNKSLRTTIQLDLFADSLIMIIGVARYHLFNKEGKEDSASGNALHNATDIMGAFHVRQGQLLKNAPTTRKPLPPSAPELGEGSPWN